MTAFFVTQANHLARGRIYTYQLPLEVAIIHQLCKQIVIRAIEHTQHLLPDYLQLTISRTLRDLPDGSVIGSASLRRQAQLLAMNPTFKVVNFRGNVQTRLKKIENGE